MSVNSRLAELGVVDHSDEELVATVNFKVDSSGSLEKFTLISQALQNYIGESGMIDYRDIRPGQRASEFLDLCLIPTIEI